MFHNKALGAAIAMALSLGVNSTEAATFQLCLRSDQLPSYGSTTFDASKHCINPSAALGYAYEQFGTSQADLSYPFRARYAVTSTIGTNYDFYITFTLSNGATWKNALTSANLIFSDTAGGALGTAAAPKISIVNHGSTTDSDVSYLINSQAKGGVTTAQILNFEFLVSNAQKALKSAGGQITLTADLRAAQSAVPTTGTVADTALTATLATSSEGADVLIAGPIDGSKAYISVLSDGTTFEGGGIKTSTQVSYGTIQISLKTPPTLAKETVLAPSSIFNGASSLTAQTGIPWSPAFTKGKLTIDNGNFNASGDPSTGKVYIDNSDGSFNTSLVNPTSFSTDKTTAIWDFDNSKLVSIYATKARNIMLNVDGKTSIIENRKTAPKATLYVEYSGGAGVTRTAVLRHLKKNGTVCTLYNIPPSDALDVVNIRITNDSATVTGFVKGTLRGMDGIEIFKGKFLVDQGKLVPHATVHLTVDALMAGGSSWKQRAVLTLESNIPEPNMQVFGLLRAKGNKEGFPESPLMNMSTGATGDGCD
jgi:hypothetical protein